MAEVTSFAPAYRTSRGFSVAAWFAAAAEWRRNRAAAAALRSMPDHILADLGLCRADIEDMVHYGRR